MEDVRPEAVEALQSIIGRHAPLTVEADRETIVISNQATGASWTFRPVEVGRLEKNHVAHDINKLEHWTPDSKNQDQKEDQPLFISEHVTAGAGEFLREERISYLDAGGNCFLQNGSLLIFVRGQDSNDRPRAHRSIRAFNSAGLKLIFALLVRPEVASWTYRELADLVEIGRGTVGYVMKDLQKLGFVEKRGKSRTLRKTDDLMDRWATGYTERLRSELTRGRFRFLDDDKRLDWQKYFSGSRATKWGGEPAADLLTGNFRPELLTLYTREDTSTVCQELEAAPDPEGSIEILDMFWDPVELEKQDDSAGSTMEHVPPLLIYADLVASADLRARRAARKIWNQYLVADKT
jgi:hypothetical protein